MAPKRIIIPERCGQHHCKLILICPTEAITQEEGHAPVINQDICIRCGACERSCPNKAVEQTKDENPQEV